MSTRRCKTTWKSTESSAFLIRSIFNIQFSILFFACFYCQASSLDLTKSWDANFNRVWSYFPEHHRLITIRFRNAISSSSFFAIVVVFRVFLFSFELSKLSIWFDDREISTNFFFLCLFANLFLLNADFIIIRIFCRVVFTTMWSTFDCRAFRLL